MLRLAIGILILFGVSGCATFQHPDDSWTGPDKAKHFLAAGLIGAGSTLAAQQGDQSDGESFAVGMSVAMSFGAGKEFYDQRVKKTYWSGKDFFWDILGALTGSLIAIQAD